MAGAAMALRPHSVPRRGAGAALGLLSGRGGLELLLWCPCKQSMRRITEEVRLLSEAALWVAVPCWITVVALHRAV